MHDNTCHSLSVLGNDRLSVEILIVDWGLGALVEGYFDVSEDSLNVDN